MYLRLTFTYEYLTKPYAQIMSKKRYAIVDIETTGGLTKRDRITEIGIVLFDGHEILDTYQTLINPERSIPTEITRITGITNEMVADAPKFYEVAKNIVQLTEGAIFVAHNVRFDYGFLRAEFKSLGFTFTRRQLCTVRLSRQVFPELKSYSLGNLIRHFDISVNARHRALDDALATTELMKYIFAEGDQEERIKDMVNQGIKESKLPAGITMDKLRDLPETAGVYYLINSYGHIVYIGKSINIQKRVMQHFSKITRKAERLAQMVAEIDYVETGNELVAFLLESREIKIHKPEVNKAQRNGDYPYFVHQYFDEQGYIRFGILKDTIKNAKGKDIIAYYKSIPSAKSHLNSTLHHYELCQTKVGLNEKPGSCFYVTLGKCHGACTGHEEAEDYNDRAEESLDYLKRVFDENLIIIEDGRSDDECAVVLIEDGHYQGYGYIDRESLNMGVEEIKEAIQYVESNPETNGIVRNYLNGEKRKIMRL